MKKSKYWAEQVTFALRQAESGTPVPEVYHKIGISEQTFYRWKKKYISMGVADEQAELGIRLRDLAQVRVSYGYRRLHILLQREGWNVNQKRIYRLYRLEGLVMRPKKPRRHVTACRRIERPLATEVNESLVDGLHE